MLFFFNHTSPNTNPEILKRLSLKNWVKILASKFDILKWPSDIASPSITPSRVPSFK